MSTTAGPPWWSSGADALDDTADPLAAHREARASGAPDDEAPSREPDDGPDTRYERPDRSAWDVPWEDWDDRDPDPPHGSQRSSLDDAMEGLQAMIRLLARRGARGGRAGLRPHGRDESCRACPWCIALRSLGEARPEVVEHLDEAMRHVVAAARAWVDAAEDRGGWERIELDEDEPS